MADRSTELSPRQRECLRLVWDRQATSKEIAVQLGITKATVDGYIQKAVEQLGARDRRDAAAIAFGETRARSGPDTARVAQSARVEPPSPQSMQARPSSLPWRTRAQPTNTLSLGQTVMWIAVIAIGSLVALSLAASVGDGLPRVALPAIHAVHRLTR